MKAFAVIAYLIQATLVVYGLGAHTYYCWVDGANKFLVVGWAFFPLGVVHGLIRPLLG